MSESTTTSSTAISSSSPPTITSESEFHIAHISLPIQDWMSTWVHTAEAEAAAAGVGVAVPRHCTSSASPEMLPMPGFDIDDFDLDPSSWDRGAPAGEVNYPVVAATTTSTTHLHTHTPTTTPPTTTPPNDPTPGPATFITSPAAAPAAIPTPRRFPPPPLLPHLRKLVRLHGCIRGSSRTIRILQELWLPTLPPAVLLSLGFESPNTNPNPDDDLEKGEAVAQMVAGWVVRHGKRLFSGSKERAEADRRWEAWCEGMLAGRGKKDGGAEGELGGGDDTVDEEEGSTPPPPHPRPVISAPAAHQLQYPPQHPPLHPHPHPHLHTYDLNTTPNTPMPAIHAIQQAQHPYFNPNSITGFEAATAKEENMEKYPYLIVVRGERPGLEWGRYQIMGCMRL